jgi:hypothetical protein
MNEASTVLKTYGQLGEKCFTKTLTFHTNTKDGFQNYFPVSTSLYSYAKSFHTAFDLVHSIDTILCSDIGR